MQPRLADNSVRQMCPPAGSTRRKAVRSKRTLLAGRLAAACSLAAIACLLPGCQSITGSPSLSQIRIIDASPNAPGLDIYQGSSAIAYNLGFGTITSYVPVVPGTYSISADASNTRTPLVTSRASIGAAQQYTVLISDVAANLQETVLADQSTSAPTGELSFRFIDEATQLGAVDIYLVPKGAKLADVNPFLTGMTFSSVNGYLTLPVGDYAVAVVASGTTTVLYTGNVVSYAAGSARTFVILDEQVLNKPAATVITADDYDSPTVLPAS